MRKRTMDARHWNLDKPGEFNQCNQAALPVEVLRELVDDYDSAANRLNEKLLAAYDEADLQ